MASASHGGSNSLEQREIGHFFVAVTNCIAVLQASVFAMLAVVWNLELDSFGHLIVSA